MAELDEEADDLEEVASSGDVALEPNEAADLRQLVEAKLPPDILARYEVHSYRGAAVLLSEAHPEQFQDLCDALRTFSITTKMIRTAGGNESDVPKLLSKSLRPLDWKETLIRGDLIVSLVSKIPGKRRKSDPKIEGGNFVATSSSTDIKSTTSKAASLSTSSGTARTRPSIVTSTPSAPSPSAESSTSGCC